MRTKAGKVVASTGRRGVRANDVVVRLSARLTEHDVLVRYSAGYIELGVLVRQNVELLEHDTLSET